MPAEQRDPVVAEQDGPTSDGQIEVPSRAEVEDAIDTGEGLVPVGDYISVLPDGSGSTHTAIISSQAENFRAQDGSWQKIDRSLHPISGGFKTGVGPVQLFFPSTLSASSGITFGHGGASVTMRPGSGSAVAQFDGDSSITYPGIADQTDLRIEATSAGYLETLVLHGVPSTERFRWLIDARGASLQLEPEGDVGIYLAGRQVAVVPRPVVYDSANANPKVRADGFNFELSQPGGTYQLDVVYDAAWLNDAARVYPVLIDPSPQIQDLAPSRDTFASACAGETDTNYANDPELQVGFTSCNHLAFIDFFAEDWVADDRIVADASLVMYKSYTSGATDPVRVKWIATPNWDVGAVTWNNKPSVELPLHSWAAKAWGAGEADYWDLTALYQEIVQGDRADHGLRLDATNHHIFASKNSAGPPFLQLVYNDLPPAPTLTTALPNGAAVDTPSPVLSVTGFPVDPNGDDVQIQFELSENSTFTGSSVIRSPWLDSKSWAVDAGRLKDGVTYYWRAVSGDMCGESVCTNRDGAGGIHERNHSTAKTFTVATPHYGASEDWAMWSQALGNGMNLQVNQSNGNLVLDYPLDSLATPIGPLAISLSYNSQMANDVGLGAGWNVTAGPMSNQMDMPSRLVRENVATGSGLKLTNYDGGVMHFTKDGEADVYSSGAGTIREAPAATGTETKWTFTTSSGGLYVFDATGNLQAARPSSSAPGQAGFTYGFSTGTGTYPHMRWIQDPLGRRVNFTWTIDRLTSISTWETSPARSWSLDYTAVGPTKLKTILDPAGSTVRVSYTAGSPLTAIEDGEAVTTADPEATIIAYSGGSPNRVSAVTAQSPVTSPANPTTFTYSPTGTGDNADFAWATDPRGQPTADPWDYLVWTDFDTAGRPIRVSGPKVLDQGVTESPHTRMVWDTNGNLICSRSPQANSVIEACIHAEGESYGALIDPLNTDYEYQTRAPFAVTKMTGPAPAAASTARPITTYTYDDQSFGVHVQAWSNSNMQGLPETDYLEPNVDVNWGTGGPVPLPWAPWTARYTGLLKTTVADTYVFRLKADGAARLIIGGKVVVDCWDTPPADFWTNCDQPDWTAKKWLGDGGGAGAYTPFTVEFRDDAGPARLELWWDQGTNVWQKIPGAGAGRLWPDLNVLKATSLKSSPSTTFSTTTYGYPDDAHILRRLPTTVTEAGRTTSTVYDGYGRVTSATNAENETTQSVFTDACLTKVTDPTGAVTEFLCNGAGDVIQTKQNIRAVGTQGAQVRTTDIAYDPMGRVVSSSVPGAPGASTTNVYDEAGRRTSVTTPLGLVTAYEYDTRGRLTKETLPDPDGPPAPYIEYTYDAVGNEIERRDVRGFVWKTSYDAMNRVVSATDPDNNTTTTNYSIANKMTTVVDPTGVTTRTTYDLLGRTASEQLGTLNARTYSYVHPLGKVQQVTESSGVFTRYAYNAFGEVTSETKPEGSGGSDTARAYTRDGVGRVTMMVDRMEQGWSYGYDDAGRLTTTTMPASLGVARVTYDDAGERIKVENGIGDGVTREWSYDVRGRVATVADSAGSTAYNYDLDNRLTFIDGPASLDQHFEYDALGRRTRRFGASSGIDDEAFGYDLAGNMTSASGSGISTSLSYDPVGRLTNLTQGASSTTYAYDRTRLDHVTNSVGTSTYTYGSRTDGLVESATDALDGTAVNYAYDPSGRLTQRTEGALTLTRTYEAASGRLDTLAYAVGATSAGSFDLGYDDESNVTTLTQTVPGYGPGNNGTWRYGYDQAGRLQTATDPGDLVTSYGYDEAGNRNRIKVPGEPELVTQFDSAGRPTTATDGVTTTTFASDAWGRLNKVTPQADVTTTYTYDSWGRMTRAKTGPFVTRTIDYTHDALDRTVSRSDTVEGLTAYAYVGATEDLASVSDPNALTRYSWGPDGPLSQKRVTTLRRVIANPHGDVVGLRDTATNANVGQVAFGPWGERRLALGDAAHLGFQGQLTDGATGLVDMTSRQYNPTLGHFMTPDVMSGDPMNPVSLNAFAYGHDSPVTMSDPDGTCPPDAGCGAPFWFDKEQARKWNKDQTRRSRKETNAGWAGDAGERFADAYAVAQRVMKAQMGLLRARLHRAVDRAMRGLLHSEVAFAISACFFFCIQVQWATDSGFEGSFGFLQVDPRAPFSAARGFGLAGTVAIGSESPGTGIGAMGCYRVCVGAYRNVSGRRGGGFVFGVGTPGIYSPVSLDPNPGQ